MFTSTYSLSTKPFVGFVLRLGFYSMSVILLVVDAQRGFVRDLYTQRVGRDIIDAIDTGVFDGVIATRFKNAYGSSFERLMDWHSMMDADPMVELIDGIAERSDVVMDKYTYGCVTEVFMQQLCALCSGQFPDTVYISGFDTDACVLASTIQLFEVGIRPVVISRLCASSGGITYHEAGLRCLRRLIGQENII